VGLFCWCVEMELEQFRQSLGENIETLLEDFLEGELAKGGVLQQLQEAIDNEGPLWSRHGGSRPRRTSNLMRSKPGDIPSCMRITLRIIPHTVRSHFGDDIA
jgi:hypothetical protein